MTSVSNRITVAELTTLEEWDAISQFWDDLVLRCPEASISNSYPYLRNLYTRFLNLPAYKLAILILKDETGKPIGAAPMIRFKRWMAGFPVNIISFIYEDAITDRTQFLFPDRRSEQLQTVFQYLHADNDNWDVLELDEQVIDKEYESIAGSIFKDSHIYQQNLIFPEIGPYLKMDFGADGWEKYLMTRSKKHRKNWRHLQNRLTREGTMSVTRHTGDEDLVPFVTEYQELEQKSWKVGNPSFLSTEIREFYLELAAALRSKGNLHFSFLRLNGVPIAGVISMSFNDRYVGLKTAYDENFSHYSPGFLVCGYDIKWAMENGYSEFDFMSGSLTNKMSWTDSHRNLHSLHIVKKRAFSGLFYLAQFKIVPIFAKYWGKLGWKQVQRSFLGIPSDAGKN